MPLMKDVRYDMLPSKMQTIARRWVEDGGPVYSGLLRAVLANDFVEFFAQADLENRDAGNTWAKWVYNECPSAAWKTEENIEAWAKGGGFKGVYPEAAKAGAP